MKEFALYFILFMIYSVIGWLIEIVVVGTKEKKFINRGFMIGPYLPIYGYSSIIMIFYLNHYKDNIVTVFLLAVIVCSIMEYLVSYFLEKIFNARWWDYSTRKFNINGRVCLTNAFAFGILGVLLVYIVNPFLEELLLKINSKLLIIIALWLLTIYIVDLILSFDVTFRLKNKITKLKKDNTEEFNVKVKEMIESKMLNRRIIKAFPKLKNNIFKDTVNNIKKEIEEIVGKK